MDYNIRVADVKDAEFLAKYRIEFIRLLGYDVPKKDEEEIFKNLKLQIERKINKSLICIIAEANGEVAGTAYMTIEEGLYHPDTPEGITGHIVNVHTEDKFRGNGVASGMIKKLIECSKEKGIEKITLDATVMGEPIYRKLGFKSDIDPILPTAMYYLLKD